MRVIELNAQNWRTVIQLRRCLLAGLTLEAIALCFPAEAQSCIETFYQRTDTTKLNWVVYLSNGTAFVLEGGDAVFPDEWKPGVEVGVCANSDHPYAITNLWTKETVAGWPMGSKEAPSE
jgi:hypothetical protein